MARFTDHMARQECNQLAAIEDDFHDKGHEVDELDSGTEQPELEPREEPGPAARASRTSSPLPGVEGLPTSPPGTTNGGKPKGKTPAPKTAESRPATASTAGRLHLRGVR